MLWQIVLAVIVCIVLWKLLTKEQNDLRKLPGPPRLPIVGNALVFLGLSHSELFKFITSLPKIYGNRIVINFFNLYILHIFDVADMEIVLSHSRNIRKAKGYYYLQPWLGDGLLISTGTKWHQRRKILTPTFHFEVLKSFMKVFEEKSRGLVMDLKKMVSEGSDVVDVMNVISDFALYTIWETAMGVRLDASKAEEKLKYKNAIFEIGHLFIKRVSTIWLHSDFIFNMLPVGRRFAECLKIVHHFANSVIEEKRKSYDGKNIETESSSKRRLAFLDLLLEAERKGEIDAEGIKDEVNTFMFEGHDTTATALTFGLMLLADDEEVQERLFKECKSILGESDRTLNMSELNEMKYLEAVIKEVLRLYPSVPFIGREIVEDFYLGDIKVPKGSEVNLHIYDMHRNPALYPDPEAFLPERFLAGEARHPYAYVPFSAGPRNCIGQKFAKLEMKSAICEIVRHFRLQPLKKGARPIIKSDIVMRPAETIYVKFIPRQ